MTFGATAAGAVAVPMNSWWTTEELDYGFEDSGENISCIEAEAGIYKHSDIEEVAVFGLSDERLGEIVGAAVVLKEGCSMTDEALREFLRGHLAAFKNNLLKAPTNKL